MFQRFQVGDLVVTQNALYFPELDGSLAVVTGDLGDRRSFDFAKAAYIVLPACYAIELVGSSRAFNVTPGQIRKVHDPDGENEEMDLSAPFLEGLTAAERSRRAVTANVHG